VEPPFNVPEFKVFLHVKLNLKDPKLIISVLSDPHLRFSSVLCPNSLLPREILNGGFAVYSSTVIYNTVFIYLVALWIQNKSCIKYEI
jgi:hypothetical protein